MKDYEIIDSKYIEAIIMTAQGRSIQKIADQYDVNYRTIQNWKKRTDFQELVKKCTIELFHKSISAVFLGSERAAKELLKIIDDPATSNKTKLQAIKLMFDIGDKFQKNQYICESPEVTALNILVKRNIVDIDTVRGILDAIRQSENLLEEGIRQVFNG
ncbi:MAG: helix-turn-helix domain containing protein [Rhizonema sp. PD37]|nr:helix-turn-helix domain containing protein [Rhizonema sp. PD37]